MVQWFNNYGAHNMDEAYRLCEDIVVINNGAEERSGDKKSVFNNQKTVQTAD